MKSADEHLSRDISSLKRDGRIRPISMEELRKRYGDELRAMNHVPEDLADTSDFDSCSAMDCTGRLSLCPRQSLNPMRICTGFFQKLQRNRGRCRSLLLFPFSFWYTDVIKGDDAAAAPSSTKASVNRRSFHL